jgi:hypothetical protein
MKNVNKAERILERLSPKPMPSEIKERILLKAQQKKGDFRTISPAYRALFGISLILLLIVFLGDLVIRKSEYRYLVSIMNGQQVSEDTLEEEFKEMTDGLINIEDESYLNHWLTRHYPMHKKHGKLRDYQDILDILKEEINGT